MVTFFLILGLVIFLGLAASLFILTRRLLKKLQTYENWILEFKADVVNTLALMRALDKQGTFASPVKSNDEGVFESDDQVGHVFKELLDLVEKLNQRTQ